jgi:hypothetical protein
VTKHCQRKVLQAQDALIRVADDDPSKYLAAWVACTKRQRPCNMPTGTWMRLHRVLAGKNHSRFAAHLCQE